MAVHYLFISAALLQLFYVAVRDLTTWRISNGSNLALAVTFVIYRLAVGDVQLLLLHGLVAAFTLLFLLFPFAKGWIGGGDAKFLVVAMLWVGSECALVFSLTLTLCTLIYVAVSRYGMAPQAAAGARQRIPFGCPGAAGLGLALLFCGMP